LAQIEAEQLLGLSGWYRPRPPGDAALRGGIALGDVHQRLPLVDELADLLALRSDSA
jgi:hypothetical protein